MGTVEQKAVQPRDMENRKRELAVVLLKESGDFGCEEIKEMQSRQRRNKEI